MNPEQGAKRAGKTPSPSGRLEAAGSSRTHVYLDDETLQRMIETFGPLEYSQFAATFSPQGSYQNLGDPQDPFGVALSWQSDLDWTPPETGTKRKSKSPRTEKSPAPPYLLPAPAEGEEGTPGASQAQRESLMEWFDRSVEKELRKRRTSPSPTAVDPALAAAKARHALNLSRGAAERISETGAGGAVEIAARLATDFTTDLTDAVEKLAKAEAICSYAEALHAAEEAAKQAPPEMAEKAAVEEARRIQTEFHEVKETVGGPRPIEVVGYVGITRPRHPKKP